MYTREEAETTIQAITQAAKAHDYESLAQVGAVHGAKYLRSQLDDHVPNSDLGFNREHYIFKDGNLVKMIWIPLVKIENTPWTAEEVFGKGDKNLKQALGKHFRKYDADAILMVRFQILDHGPISISEVYRDVDSVVARSTQVA